MNKQTAKSCGFNKGTDAIEYCEILATDKRNCECDDESCCKDCVTLAASNTEDNQRDYSPFEFLAAEFNDSEESDDLWKAYEEGVMDGIRAGMAARLAAEKHKLFTERYAPKH